MKLNPQQKRSVLTKKKIKDTAKKLFSEKGYYSVTSNIIAKEARVPIGSFYNYFENKKDVILELIRDSNKDFHKETIQKYLEMDFEIKSPEDTSKFITYSLVDTLRSNYLSDPLYKITHPLQFTETDVLALKEDLRIKEIELIKVVLKKVHKFHKLKNLPIKAKLIHSTIENVILYIHLLGSDFKEEKLVEETAKMIYCYLFSDK